MHTAVQISKLNDFIFCPNSIYLHAIYESFAETTYKQKPQIVGTLAHKNIDKREYSSAKRYMQGSPVYSEKYSIVGKIDIYDTADKALIERKYKVKKVYDGFRYQLYAQYFCLLEKGYEVKEMYIHSLSDNKRYQIDLPDETEIKRFENLLDQINHFYFKNESLDIPKEKCMNCIYNTLCPYAKSS